MADSSTNMTLRNPLAEAGLGLGILAVGAMHSWTQPPTMTNFGVALAFVVVGWAIVGHGYWRDKRDA